MSDRHDDPPDGQSGESQPGESQSGESQSGHDEDQPDEAAEHSELEVFGRGVRTALRNNATAYGFSITITAAYGLVTGSRGNGNAVETLSFAFGAALAFVLIGGVFVARFPHGRLPESGQVATLTGGVDVLTIVVAIMVALGLSRISGFAAWPVTAFGTVLAYLLVGGLNVLLARKIAHRTSFGRSQ